MKRLVPVPETARSAHAVFTADPVEPVADLQIPPPSLLRRFGASDDQITALERRPFAHLFLVDSTPTAAADHLVEARQRAFAFALEHDGVVVDLLAPRVIDASECNPAVAAHWVTFDLDGDVVRSRGLEAFGLPELQIATGPDDTHMILAIGMGLAHRLITEWPNHDPVGPAAVTLHDIALGFGDTAGAPHEPALDLMLTYRDHALDVTLLADASSLFQ